MVSATFDVRVSGAASKDQAYAVRAETPVEAAMEVFFRIFEVVPDVVELDRHVSDGRTVTTVKLARNRQTEVVEIEVQARQSADG